MIKPIISLNASGRKTSKVSSILPIDGSGDFDFARSTSIGVRNIVGEYVTYVPNTPIFAINPNDGCPIIDMEKAINNTMSYGESFTTNWVRNSVNISSTSELGPNDTSNMVLLETNSTGSAENSLHQITSMATGLTYTLSIFVKRTDTDLFYIRELTAFGDVIIDLSNQTVVKNDNEYKVTFENYVNRVVRIGITFTTPSTFNFNRIYFGITSDPTNVSSILPIGSSILIWGSQLEESPFMTNYVPSIGSVLGVRTRSILDLSNIPELINSEEGYFNLNCSFLADGAGFSINDGTGSSGDMIFIFANVPNETIILIKYVGGVLDFSMTTEVGFLELGKFYDISVRWKLNNWALQIDGFEVDSSVGTTFAPNTLNSVGFYAGDDTFKTFVGKIKSLEIYNTADAYPEPITNAVTTLNLNNQNLTTLDVSIYPELTTLVANNNCFDSDVLDQIFIDLDNNGKLGIVVEIDTGRTTASNTAKNNLINKGASIVETPSTSPCSVISPYIFTFGLA